MVNNVRRPFEFETAVKDKEAAKENIKVRYCIECHVIVLVFFIKHIYIYLYGCIIHVYIRLLKMNDLNY